MATPSNKIENYFVNGLTKKQREILDAIGCGNYSLSGIFQSKNAVLGLLGMGLIESCGKKVICNDRFGMVTAQEYQMPLNIHLQWCSYQSKEYDKEFDNDIS